MNEQPSLRLRFLGGAQTVTGSRYLLTYGEKKILVDCGLFQGLKELRLKNWDRFPIDPKEIDAIVLTHAHIDHSGYIPRLIKEGFTGKIYCTQATFELCRILLLDTGYLQQEEARYMNKRGLSKHKVALPLFSKDEAEASLEYFVPTEFETSFEVIPDIQAKFLYAGHILGASIALIEAGSKKIAFSGDVGRAEDAMLYPPATLPEIDYLVVESTYGNQKHEAIDPFAELEAIVKETFQKKSIVMIPAFAVGRAQELMFYLSELMKAARIPKIPMYLNSPMATSVTKLLNQFPKLHKLSEPQCRHLNEVFKYVESIEESKAINERKGPMLIISASGMVTGGRILHHLEAFAPNPNNLILISGYQAEGTRGRAIQDGAKEIKIHGQMVPICAQVRTLENISAHADYVEILDWLAKSKLKPQKVFVVHGEIEAAAEMKRHLFDKFSWNCVIPRQDQEFPL